VFFIISCCLYMVFHSMIEAMVLIFRRLRHDRRSDPAMAAVAITSAWRCGVGYIALFGIAVETGVVMVVYLHEAWTRDSPSGATLTAMTFARRPSKERCSACAQADDRLRRVASLIRFCGTGIGSDVMSRCAAPIVAE